MVQMVKIAAVLVLVSAYAGAQVLQPSNGGTGEAGTVTGVLYGNALSAFTQATAAQIVSGIGATAVANATNASTVNSNTFPASAGFTSGGIPYFSSTSAVGSSSLLTHYGVLYGGGSAAAPVATAASTTTTNALFATATAPAWRNIAYTDLPSLSANTLLGALTATTPSGLALPSCSTSSSALIWTSGTGFTCNSSIVAASATGQAGSVANAMTMNNGGAGAASGTTFNGSAAQTLSYNTIGAAPIANPVFTQNIGLNGTPAVNDLISTNGVTTNTGTSVYGFDVNYTSQATQTNFLLGFRFVPTTAASVTVGNVIAFNSAGITVGSGGTVTRYVGFDDSNAANHRATNNAAFTDNFVFTGNWFINQSGTDPSSFGGAIAAPSFNKVTVTTPASGATLTIANGSTLQTTGAFTLNLTATAASTPTFPTGTTTLPQMVCKGTAAVTTTAVASGACQTTVTSACTNALTTDAIAWSYASFGTPATDGCLIVNAWATAGNANFSRCNPTAASITPDALTINFHITR